MSRVAKSTWRAGQLVTVAAVLLSACSTDSATGPLPNGAGAPVPVTVSAVLPTASTVAGLSVTVTGPGIAAPIVANLTVSGTQARGTVTVPTGQDRTFIVRAFDGSAIQTDEGSARINILPGTNPELAITLYPIGGDTPIVVTFGNYTLTLAPGDGSMPTLGTRQYTATITDAKGAAVANPAITWASLNPVVASVTQAGLVNAHVAGETRIIASYGGTAAQAVLTVTDGPAGVATLTVTGDASVVSGSRGHLHAAARDAAGNILTGRTISWASSDNAIGSITQGEDGDVSVNARLAGTITVTATSDGASGTAQVTVVPGPLAIVDVSPASATIGRGAVLQLAATATDAAGNGLPNATIAWTTGDGGPLTVDGAGLVHGTAAGTADVTATATDLASGATAIGTTTITVTAPSAVSIAVGQYHSCAALSDGTAYCWGTNDSFGRLGDGTTAPRLVPTAVAANDVPLLSVAAGRDNSCAITDSHRVECWGRNNPGGAVGDGSDVDQLRPVGLDLRGGQLSLGYGFGCALEGESRRDASTLYCWGINSTGALGSGDDANSATPKAVSSQFASVYAGTAHSCALTPAGEAWCWGSNDNQQLGTGSPNQMEFAPARVSTDLRFRTLAAGGMMTCGLTTAGEVYCWGPQEVTYGDDREIVHGTPLPVRVGQPVSQIYAGYGHLCALVRDGTAYCWGYGGWGQLGNGSTAITGPGVVGDGTLHFSQLATGYQSTCGIQSETGSIFCWGRNEEGQLGDGTTNGRLIPVEISIPAAAAVVSRR